MCTQSSQVAQNKFGPSLAPVAQIWQTGVDRTSAIISRGMWAGWPGDSVGRAGPKQFCYVGGNDLGPLTSPCSGKPVWASAPWKHRRNINNLLWLAAWISHLIKDRSGADSCNHGRISPVQWSRGIYVTVTEVKHLHKHNSSKDLSRITHSWCFFPRNDTKLVFQELCKSSVMCVCVCVRVGVCVCVCVLVVQHYHRCFIRARCLEWATETWSQREIELNVSEPPWALHCSSRAHNRTEGQQGNTQRRERERKTDTRKSLYKMVIHWSSWKPLTYLKIPNC